MNLQRTQMAGQARHGGKRRYPRRALGTIVGLSLLAAVTTWTSVHLARSSSPAGARAGTMLANVVNEPAPRPVVPRIFYLVSSKEQAATLTAELSRQAGYWTDAGLVAPEPIIGVVTTTEEERAFYQAAGEAAGELLNVEVVDLRDR